MQKEIRETILQEQRKYISRHDAKRFEGVTHNIGDIVMLQRVPTVTGESTKLQPKYRGTMVVTEILASNIYRVSTIKGSGERYFITTAHVSQLKLYKLPDDEESSSDGELESTAEDEPGAADDFLSYEAKTEKIPKKSRFLAPPPPVSTSFSKLQN
ncbi:hypothetical protein RI129_006473 [Pyrocoelia pectoralis]|uniref:Uncharacterized protein n=1 Tax=Pyrocoelia pectoralis TaxID=417401 RepID=A0AAN7ZNU5_9COLE